MRDFVKLLPDNNGGWTTLFFHGDEPSDYTYHCICDPEEKSTCDASAARLVMHSENPISHHSLESFSTFYSRMVFGRLGICLEQENGWFARKKLATRSRCFGARPWKAYYAARIRSLFKSLAETRQKHSGFKRYPKLLALERQLISRMKHYLVEPERYVPIRGKPLPRRRYLEGALAPSLVGTSVCDICGVFLVPTSSPSDT